MCCISQKYICKFWCNVIKYFSYLKENHIICPWERTGQARAHKPYLGGGIIIYWFYKYILRLDRYFLDLSTIKYLYQSLNTLIYNRFNQNNSAMLTFQNISINSEDTLERLTNWLPVTILIAKQPYYSLGYVVKRNKTMQKGAL